MSFQVSYMVVAPSIIFYVLAHGGSRNMYGIILSAFSFSSFCAKPFVGMASDRYGFRMPYIICLLISAAGGLIYMLASAFYGNKAVTLMLIGRLMGGVGAASAALGYAYLAKVVPHEEQTQTNSLLSMTRIIGMSTGPGLNYFLAEIDTEIFGFKIDSLNSVGLVLLASNLLALSSILLFLEEPKTDHTAPPKEETARDGNRLWTIVRSLFCFEIMVPVFAMFAFNSSFQIIEAGLAPAASHGMGWSPVGVSGILGSMSIFVFLNMMVVFSLSSRKVRDEHIMLFGATVSATGFFLVWHLWRWQAEPWQYVLPAVLGVSAYPYLAAPTRSLFTKAVDDIPALEQHQGTMQAVLSMFASVAGFVTPGLVASFVLRDPEDVESSPDHREFSPFVLASPTMSMMVFAGVVVLLMRNLRKEKIMDTFDETIADESSSLVGTKQPQRKKRYSAQVEADRRRSTVIMGMVQSSMYDEHCMHEDYDEEIHQERRSSSWAFA